VGIYPSFLEPPNTGCFHLSTSHYSITRLNLSIYICFPNNDDLDMMLHSKSTTWKLQYISRVGNQCIFMFPWTRKERRCNKITYKSSWRTTFPSWTWNGQIQITHKKSDHSKSYKFHSLYTHWWCQSLNTKYLGKLQRYTSKQFVHTQRLYAPII